MDIPDSKFDPINWLNIKPIRGQTTHLPTSEHLQNLKTVLCYSGYITPASNMIHEVGSSYNLDNLKKKIPTPLIMTKILINY